MLLSLVLVTAIGLQGYISAYFAAWAMQLLSQRMQLLSQ